METSLYNEKGDPVAYISGDYNRTIYLTDGSPVAYLYNRDHVYGFNGRHLGWWIEEIFYNHDGERVGFTSNTCPLPIGRKPLKIKEQSVDEVRPRWTAPPLPKLSFGFADSDLKDLLLKGQVVGSYNEE